MKVHARLCLATIVTMVAAPSASAMTRDNASVDNLTILTLDEDDQVGEVRTQLSEWLDTGNRIALSGPAPLLDQIRPEGVYAWPSTNTIVLDPAAGLGIFGFDAADEEQRIEILRHWAWADDTPVASVSARSRVAAGGNGRISNVAFDLSATSPSAVCQTFRRKMTSSLFTTDRPGEDELPAFRREMRRWCQYGNLSLHRAARPKFHIEPFQFSDEPRLTLLTEWALLRNEDPVEPSRTTYLFWVKTVGDGAGSGFTRVDGTEAYIDPIQGGVRRLLDASIHSGWGPLEYDGVLTAWPLNSSFPDNGNTHAFICDGPDGVELFGCPRGLRLRSLYPADSIDGVVTVSLAERFIVGGNAQTGVSIDSTGKITPSVSFSLNLVHATTDTAQSEMRLVRTRTNADTVYYRTTRWTPDVPAVYRWIKARAHEGGLAQATPLAATLNPRYEILWELPLEENAGFKLSYQVIYEAGWNTCFNGPNCVRHVQPPDRSLSPKARVGWKDRLSLRMPVN